MQVPDDDGVERCAAAGAGEDGRAAGRTGARSLAARQRPVLEEIHRPLGLPGRGDGGDVRLDLDVDLDLLAPVEAPHAAEPERSDDDRTHLGDADRLIRARTSGARYAERRSMRPAARVVHGGEEGVEEVLEEDDRELRIEAAEVLEAASRGDEARSRSHGYLPARRRHGTRRAAAPLLHAAAADLGGDVDAHDDAEDEELQRPGQVREDEPDDRAQSVAPSAAAASSAVAASPPTAAAPAVGRTPARACVRVGGKGDDERDCDGDAREGREGALASRHHRRVGQLVHVVLAARQRRSEGGPDRRGRLPRRRRSRRRARGSRKGLAPGISRSLASTPTSATSSTRRSSVDT